MDGNQSVSRQKNKHHNYNIREYYTTINIHNKMSSQQQLESLKVTQLKSLLLEKLPKSPESQKIVNGLRKKKDLIEKLVECQKSEEGGKDNKSGVAAKSSTSQSSIKNSLPAISTNNSLDILSEQRMLARAKRFNLSSTKKSTSLPGSNPSNKGWQEALKRRAQRFGTGSI